MTDLTTRQIAERIAEAVLRETQHDLCIPLPGNYIEKDIPYGADAVLRTLRENHVWLHRTVQSADGVIDGEAPTEVLPEVET